MKNLITIFIGILIFASTCLSAEIGVIREFHGRRPALNKFRIDRKDLMDMNQNGSPDIVVRRNGVLYVFDSRTKEKLWEYQLSNLTLNQKHLKFQPSDVVPVEGFSFNFIGFARFDDTDIIHVILGVIDTANPSGWHTVIINSQTNEIEYNTIGKPISMLLLPAVQSVVVSYDDQSNTCRIIGVLVALKTSYTENPNLNLTNHSDDFTLSLKFKSDPGLQLAYDPDLFSSPEESDLDGDGYSDFPMLMIDSGNVTGMIVRGGDSIGVIWKYAFPEEYKTNMLKGFRGFADLNGDGEKEAILGDNLAVTLDGTVHVIAENFEIIDIEDVDNDGYDDVIGLNTADSTIVVYGLQGATSVSDNDLKRIGFQLFQNYPNPFNPSTNISFSILKEGEVKLIIYNELGQKVRTLLNKFKHAGSYTLSWDGRNDKGNLLSSGRYFYSLETGGLVQTRKMLFLK